MGEGEKVKKMIEKKRKTLFTKNYRKRKRVKKYENVKNKVNK